MNGGYRAGMNPLPQLVFDRLRHVRERVQRRIWASSVPLPVAGGPVTPEPAPFATARRQRFAPVATGTHFGPPGGGWGGRWFRIAIPAARAGERGRRFLRWECQGETTVWIDGEPWSGLDVGHRCCPLPDRACTLWLDHGLWQTGLWVPGAQPIPVHGCRFDGASLALRDQQAWSTSFDVECLEQLVRHLLDKDRVQPPYIGYHPELADVDPLLRRLLGSIEGALEAYRDEDLGALSRAIRGVYAGFRAEGWQPRAELVGHAHIDLVWLWPEAVTEAKGVHTFSTMLRLMERYPEFVYTQTQPALYRAIEKRVPGLARQIARRIRDGRWEAQGAFEVEPDNQLPCGEALARSIAIGQAKFAELTGAPARTCWIPDVFGYAGCLPQLLVQSGVTRFYTTKMTWSAVTRFPYSSFIWRGTDGSEVLTHLCATGYNGDAQLHELVGPLRKHRNLEQHPAMLLPTGFGDGGGGTTEDQLERARRFADLAGVPKTGWTTVDGFFDRLESARGSLPTYQGELYLEYHRGTYTTQSQFKAAHRALERALQTHEAVRVATGAGPLDEAGQKRWQRLAFAQFHDAIPGSSIGLVYQQFTPELRGHAQAAISAAAQDLAGRASGFAVVNPLAWPVERVVEVPGRHRGLALSDGTPVVVQAVGSGRQSATLALVTLPPLGGVRLVPASATAADSALHASPTALGNGRVEAAFDRQGRLSRLDIDGSAVALAAPAWFRLYADQPAAFDAWDIDHEALAVHDAVAGARLQVVESGPLRCVLAGTVALPKACGTLTVRYELDAGSSYLRIVVEADWKANRRLLKWHLPTAYRGREARYGAPFGSYLRAQQPGLLKEEAQWEVPGNRWAAVLGDDLEGAAIVTEAKYGFSCRDGDLGLSLLRAPCDPDPTADRGQHRMVFCVGRHQRVAAGTEPTTAGAADTLFTPPLVVAGGQAPSSPFALADTGSLVPAWVVPAADGFTLRLHEVDGRSGSAVLRLTLAARRVELVDLRGKLQAVLRPAKDGYAIPYQAHRIVSVRVVWA
jgi:alpha-mannosidase